MRAHDFDAWRLKRRARGKNSAWPLETREGLRFIDTDHGRIRVRIAGSGHRTIVFGCDPPNVVESYDEIIRLLGARYRIVCFETLGYGFSYPTTGFGYSREEYADALTQMLVALDLAPYCLVAVCVGTFPALMVAHARPDLVERLVLMQAVRWPDQCIWAEAVIKRFSLAAAGIPVIGHHVTRIPLLGQLVWAAAERRFAERTHPHVIYKAAERQERFHQIADPLYDAHAHGACCCWASSFQNYFQDPTEPPQVSQPALLLWASNDRSHLHSDPQAMKAYAPHAHWVEIPDTGHHLDLENPALVSATIERFMQSE